MSKNDSSKEKDRLDKFLAEFEMKYGEQCDLARLAQETTLTPAWGAMYESQFKGHREVHRRCISEVAAVAKTLETRESDEDYEKLIKESVKRLTEERIRFEAWQTRCVRPLNQCVTTAREIRDECARQAHHLQALQPLVYAGFAASVADRVKTWPVLDFDETTGRVSVREPEAGAATRWVAA